MPQHLQSLATSPWLLVVVFAVAGLDAVLPFMPSESTVVAVGVLAAGTGRPHLVPLILAAAAGAYLGDRVSYQIGRAGRGTVSLRMQRGRRSKLVHDWVHRLLRHRGGLVIVFARYLPGGRSTTAFAAGVVGYPVGRFGLYTAAGVVLWAIEASLLGYLGGAAFAGRPLLGLAVGWGGALAVTGVAVLVQRFVGPVGRLAGLVWRLGPVRRVVGRGRRLGPVWRVVGRGLRLGPMRRVVGLVPALVGLVRRLVSPGRPIRLMSRAGRARPDRAAKSRPPAP